MVLLGLVHALRLLLRFVCAVPDVAAKTLRVDRKLRKYLAKRKTAQLQGLVNPNILRGGFCYHSCLEHIGFVTPNFLQMSYNTLM